MIGEWPAENQEKRGYVLSSPGWHEGVIGIVASRLTELYSRPVIMIAEDPENGLGKGSGRSIGAFDLYASLVELSSSLVAYGGHRAACGLTIETAGIEAFQRQFADYAHDLLADEEIKPSRYVDALACGRELTLELTQELSRLEPFGLGNPSVELLVTDARIQGDRVTRDGQHLQCQVVAGGARSKAIGFGQAYLQEAIRRTPNWDIAFQLERNEFNGSVSTQMQLREIFPRESREAGETGLCQTRCDFDCPDRVIGDEFWGLVDSGTAIPEAWMAGGDAGSDEILAALETDGRLTDRRDFGGIASQITRLMVGGENVLLLTSDVARRRRLVSHDIQVANGGAGLTLLAGARCGTPVLTERLLRLRDGGHSLLLADFATVTRLPELLDGFQHLVFVDPPWNSHIFSLVTAAAPGAYVHLFYCSDEVQFTRKVLEHEYDLRGPLTKVYRHLETGKNYPLDDTTERLLLAGGKHLRQPVQIARCLKILRELDLISVEDEVERPMLTLLEGEKTELDRSPTYRAVQAFYKECLQFLSKSPSAKVI